MDALPEPRLDSLPAVTETDQRPGPRGDNFRSRRRAWRRQISFLFARVAEFVTLDANAPSMKKRHWKIAGINFDHFHMGDLLRYAHEHSQTEIVGISDEQPARMEEAIRKGLISRERAFTDYRQCLEETKPDVVILCPAASKHGEWVKKVAPYGPHLMVEKPFAASLKEADAMIKAMAPNQTLMINWPLQWVGSHRKAHELVSSGAIGDVLNVW